MLEAQFMMFLVDRIDTKARAIPASASQQELLLYIDQLKMALPEVVETRRARPKRVGKRDSGTPSLT